MEYKKHLLGGASALALTIGIAQADPSVPIVGNFVFGITSATVSATTSQEVTSGSIAALSSQVNNDLALTASVDSNTVTTVTGATVQGGTSATVSNLMSATAIANQFAALSSATLSAFIVDPSSAPAAGNATIGSSQLNYNSLNTTTIGRLGQVGTLTGSGSSATRTGALGNEFTFTAADSYGAPVIVSSNTFAAGANGNLALGSISGGIPLGGLAAGPAQVSVTGIASSSSSSLTPVGESIIVLAPLSNSNVQQNLAGASSTTRTAASIANSLLAADFTGVAGFNGGSVTASSNAFTADVAANSATVGIDLTGTVLPSFGGGAALLTAQGNRTENSSSTLTIAAENLNSTLRVQMQAGTGELYQMASSSAVISGNSVISRAALNDITAQGLTTSSTLAANGTGGLGGAGSTTTPLVISPINTAANSSINGAASTGTTTTLASTADYLNAAVQNNVGQSGSLSGTSTVDNAILGYFGGVTTGSVTMQSNAVNATMQGNRAVLATTLPSAAAGAQNVTAAYQSNEGVALTGTLSGTQLRITDSSGMTTDLTQAYFSSVVGAATGGTFTDANLTIGSAAGTGLGNEVRALVLGNNAAVTANIGQNALASGTTLSAAEFLMTGRSATDPAGTSVSLTAPTTVGVVQQNRDATIASNVTHPAAGSGNGLFQIDAYQGLLNGSASIGANALRSTAAGNLADASATVSAAAGSTVGGGVLVGTVQGNVGSSIFAGLGSTTDGATVVGPKASIGIGALEGATAQVVNNTFVAVGAGNSASAALTIPVNTIAGGSFSTFSVSPNPSVRANYLVANSQANAGTTIAATTLDAPGYQALASIGGDEPFSSLSGFYGSLGLASSTLNVGASSFTNARALVTGNTISTMAVGNEYGALASGFVAPTTSAGTFTALALVNDQANIPSSAGTNSTVTSANAGGGFIVATAGSPAGATAGDISGLGGAVVNSTLSVTGNTASATAIANTTRLTVSGIATSGAGSETTATTLGQTVTVSTGTASPVSQGGVTLTSTQLNSYASSASTTPVVLATSLMQNFGVNWNASGSAPTGSIFEVNTNAMTATATANSADLSASLATGPAFTSSVGLNNSQMNFGPSSSSTAVDARVGSGFFNAGTGVASTYGLGSSNSQISVANNTMTALSTINAATLSITAPSTVTVQSDGSALMANAQAGVAGTEITTGPRMGAINSQVIANSTAIAAAQDGIFGANAAATGGTIDVNANAVLARVRGNTATTNLTLPRIDGTVAAVSSQAAASVSLTSETAGMTFRAISDNSITESSSVTVNGNSVAALSSMNSNTMTATGLGQTSAPTATSVSLAASSPSSGQISVDTISAVMSLVNAQSNQGGGNYAAVSNSAARVDLTNTSTAGSPISLTSNAFTAEANGNVSAQAIIADGAGAANSRGGFGVASSQLSGSAAAPAINDASVTSTQIRVTVVAPASGSSTMLSAPVTINLNRVEATATANTSSLGISFPGSMRSTGAGGSDGYASVGEAASSPTSVVADYGVLNSQAITGNATNASTARASVSSTEITAALANSSTTSSPLTLDSNSVLAKASGNVTAMSITSNLDGVASASAGRAWQASNQSMDYGAVSATNQGTSISAALSNSAPSSAVLENSPVSMSGNTLGASATGNSASLNSGFASSTRLSSASSGGATVSQAALGQTYAEGGAGMVLLNYQRGANSTVGATMSGASIGFSAAAMSGAVSIQNNLVYASALGNSATLAIAGGQGGGAMQSTNFQSNARSTIAASVAGTSMAAQMEKAPSVGAPISVTGNVLRAVALGNTLTTAVGR